MIKSENGLNRIENFMSRVSLRNLLFMNAMKFCKNYYISDRINIKRLHQKISVVYCQA